MTNILQRGRYTTNQIIYLFFPKASEPPAWPGGGADERHPSHHRGGRDDALAGSWEEPFRTAPGKTADRIHKIQEMAEFYGIFLSDVVINVWFKHN